jgi:Fe2+ or Zn2+ uptake regulation protein
MIDVVTRFIPDFMTVEQYSSHREAVWNALKENKHSTAQEIHQEINYPALLSSTRRCLHNLVDDGYAYDQLKKECSVANHSREVKAYEPTLTAMLKGLDN